MKFLFALILAHSCRASYFATATAVFGTAAIPLAALSLVGAEYLKRNTCLLQRNFPDQPDSTPSLSISTPVPTQTCYCENNDVNIVAVATDTVYSICPCPSNQTMTTILSTGTVYECVPTPIGSYSPIQQAASSTQATTCRSTFFACTDYQFVWVVAYTSLAADAFLSIAAAAFFAFYLTRATEAAKVSAVLLLVISMLASCVALFPLFYICTCDTSQLFMDVWPLLIVGGDLACTGITIFSAVRVEINPTRRVSQDSKDEV